jgi:hypothetical protein
MIGTISPPQRPAGATSTPNASAKYKPAGTMPGFRQPKSWSPEVYLRQAKLRVNWRPRSTLIQLFLQAPSSGSTASSRPVLGAELCRRASRGAGVRVMKPQAPTYEKILHIDRCKASVAPSPIDR